MRKLSVIVIVLIALGILGWVIWYKLIWRDVPQPAWISANQHDTFLYGSVGAERDAGIPYWVWLALPRMFPEYMPGNGGYVSVGFSWEQGVEMPAGFSKKRVGYIRVAGNCALCHAASYRKGPDEGPEVIPVVPGRTMNPQQLLAFLHNCAADPRFNSTEIMAEIGSATKLSWGDWLLYKFYLIPQTRRKLLSDGPVMLNSVLRDHSLNPQSDAPFAGPQLKDLAAWVKASRIPQYPLGWDSKKAEEGRSVFVNNCAECHASGGKRKGAVIPIAEIGTDPGQASRTNAAGYVPGTLDGIWARGPYLHNGSVPTIRDLLNPPEQRPRTFYRGNNLIDGKNLGFVSNLDKEKGLHFFPYDTAQPGNGNTGHFYGARLSEQEKNALVEYLKTL